VELYLLREPMGNRLKLLNKKKISRDPVEDNNLKHVRETRKGQRMVRTCLGYLEVNGNVIINGCVRELDDLENLKLEISEPPPDLKGIGVDIRGPGGELLSPVKKERGNYCIEIKDTQLHDTGFACHDIEFNDYRNDLTRELACVT
jgi:hypothetical protein